MSVLCRDILPDTFAANVNTLWEELSAEYAKLAVKTRLRAI
jgi:hypothetical protein